MSRHQLGNLVSNVRLLRLLEQLGELRFLPYFLLIMYFINIYPLIFQSFFSKIIYMGLALVSLKSTLIELVCATLEESLKLG